MAPRLTADQLAAKTAYTVAQKSAIVYVDTEPTSTLTAAFVNVTDVGYYFFDGASWVLLGSENADVLPVWKSTTNGGTYTTDDLINFGGALYKNISDANSDITPDLDTTNWEGFNIDSLVTTITPAYLAGSTWTASQADSETTLADVLVLGSTLATDTKIRQGKVRFTSAHGYGTGGETLYLSDTTAGGLTVTEPTGTAMVQIVGFVEDDKTIIIDIQDNDLAINYEYVDSTDIPSSNVSSSLAITVGTLTAPSDGKWRIYSYLYIDAIYNDTGVYRLLKDGVVIPGLDNQRLFYSQESKGTQPALAFTLEHTLDLKENEVVTLQIESINSTSPIILVTQVSGTRLEMSKVGGFLPDTNSPVITDNSASGYMDVGGMRMQWGSIMAVWFQKPYHSQPLFPTATTRSPRPFNLPLQLNYLQYKQLQKQQLNLPFPRYIMMRRQLP